ncbi:pyridine nucleotide-disulfide oxidoreductase domain-containing protein 1 [Galendromus occidentalis]|uniref:Pyridine nucleotide-disulfide oxidoreductase domain-containing protein 1 n=1 Tax=Galendromus occidentalis TaxID=34638 RepID=A0AAJ6VYA6_9ACAR|nr:pyridine nucleotide-disulfide oxidoreductase domain-containing protein 1 [Galendromus occidentalis]
MSHGSHFADFAVVGGGIAGVTCAQQLCFLNTGKSVTLISAAPVLKVVADVLKITRNIEEFTVRESSATALESQFPNLKVHNARVDAWTPDKKRLHLSSGMSLDYGKLCICTGATPTREFQAPGILVIRDTETVDDLREKLSGADEIAIIGNGGIATELVHKVQDCRIHWLIRNKSIGSTFVDSGAAHFFLESQSLAAREAEPDKSCPIYKRMRYTVTDRGEKMVDFGTALGPDWAEQNELRGHSPNKKLTIEYSCDIKTVEYDEETRKYVIALSSGKRIVVDIVLAATGVTPNPGCFSNSLELAPDGGIAVNEKFETSLSDTYAAGDVCSLENSEALWLQMRLWTQARQMGDSAARAMSGPEHLIPPYFEVFTHATHFFGFKVVLIGLFNGQGLGGEYEILLRTTANVEYIKLILKDGRMKGAILIGDTDLEEVIENLHYSQLDLTDLKENLLDPNIDLEDYFD